MKIERSSSSYYLQPNDIVAELLALSVVEHTYMQNLTIAIELDGSGGAASVDFPEAGRPVTTISCGRISTILGRSRSMPGPTSAV
ncbi:MAG: hypothetical protein GY788_11545 [bacterium]|nr:hypothetical protein [bacterium]